MNKRYHNEETTLDYSINGFKVRVWIVNPYQKYRYTIGELEAVCQNRLAQGVDTDEDGWYCAEALVEAVASHYPDVAAVQVIRPDGVGHMPYLTEYNGDPVEVKS